MNEPIESAYFNWLCAKVMRIENPTPSLTYWKLLRELQNTEFVWTIDAPMDENRAADGLDLRHEFLVETHAEADPSWLDIGCSVFEMIFAFSRRASFATGRRDKDWFWEILDNLGLSNFNDASSVRPSEIRDILDRLIWRTYEYNGQGGMFPLIDPRHDQRKVEIWYQFNEYLAENE